MASNSAVRDASATIVTLSHSSLPTDSLRVEVLARLARIVPSDAVWWAGADPATLLFTNAHRVGLPPDTTGYFVDNEFLGADFNKWSDLARDRAGVRSLTAATAGSLSRSARYRDIFQPLGLGDELRAVLRVQGSTWGLLCLHREAGRAYSAEEVTSLRRLAPHIGHGLRVALLIDNFDSPQVADGPGLVLLSSVDEIIAINQSGEQWLDELRGSDAAAIPIEVRAAAAALRAFSADGSVDPRLRVRTRAGRWAVLHASWMRAEGDPAIAIIIEEAHPLEVAPVIMLAYGLTARERSVTGLVARGSSTTEIGAELHISTDTVQDHLKAVYVKVGVGSRTELVAAIMRQQYLPRAKTRRPVGVDGFFA